MSDQATPRGIRNNNPGNLRHNPAIRWPNEMAPDKDGYCRFPAPADGLHPLARTLVAAQALHHRHTIEEVVAAFAPAADHNDVGAYVRHVASLMGVAPNQPVNLQDPGRLASAVRAFVHHENGYEPYPAAMLDAAAASALPWRAAPSPAGARPAIT